MKHWFDVATQSFRSCVADKGVKGFESLSPEALIAWADLQRLGQEPYTEKSPAQAAAILDSLLQAVLESPVPVARFLEVYATDLAIRCDMLSVLDLHQELDETLSHLPVL